MPVFAENTASVSVIKIEKRMIFLRNSAQPAEIRHIAVHTENRIADDQLFFIPVPRDHLFQTFKIAMGITFEITAGKQTSLIETRMVELIRENRAGASRKRRD